MKVALIGATGKIGSKITAELLQRGHLVTAIARNPEKAPSHKNLKAVKGDVTDPKDRREVKTFEVEGQPGDNQLSINDLVLTEVMGFLPGHRYEMAVIPRVDGETAGKADVCAKGVISLR